MSTENPQLSRFEREVRVVPRAGWAALGTIATAVAIAIGWSFFGTLSTKVGSRCILMSTAGVADVVAAAPGQVQELSVRPGDVVARGQVVGRIAQPELEDRILRARARAQELESRRAQVGVLSRRGLGLSDAALAQRRAFLQQQHALADARIHIADEQVDSTRQLLADGLVTRRALEDAEREARAARVSAADLKRQLGEVEGSRTETVKRETDERAAIELELADARRELAALEGDRRRSTEIVSPFAGRVVEVKAGRGLLVTRDTPVLGLERTDPSQARLEAVLFVAASDGKKIALDAEVQVVPATARREEHGYVSGRVRHVSDYPATPQALAASLGNEDLVREVAPFAAPFEVRVALDRDGDRPRWSRTARTTPDLKPGTLCAGDVIVRRERPVGFVIPALRQDLR